MPTLLKRDGFKFYFYANEHVPRHVHVMYGERWAKIELSTLNVAYSTLKAQELARCLEIVRVCNVTFEEKWDEWFARR